MLGQAGCPLSLVSEQALCDLGASMNAARGSPTWIRLDQSADFVLCLILRDAKDKNILPRWSCTKPYQKVDPEFLGKKFHLCRKLRAMINFLGEGGTSWAT